MRSHHLPPFEEAISYGLRLHAAVQRGDRLDLPREQAALTALALEVAAGADDGGFRGSRYAVVCWLDELFICHSSWSEPWNERKLESALYGGNDRAWEYWRQAKLAATQSEDDALRAYFVCAALGFRGKLRDDPRGLEEWFEQTKARVTRSRTGNSPRPRPRRQAHGAPPMQGEARLRRFVAVATAAIVLLAPFMTYAVMRLVFA